jgi:hypothetical protein
LFHLDSLLCSTSPSSGTPTPKADLALGSAVGHDPQVAQIGRAPTPDKAIAAGNATSEAPEAVIGDGSPVPIPDLIAAAVIGPSAGASTP